MTIIGWDDEITVGPSTELESIAIDDEPESILIEDEAETSTAKSAEKPLEPPSAEGGTDAKSTEDKASEDSPEAQEQASALPPLFIQEWNKVKLDPPKKAPALIGTEQDGILRLGDVMLFTAASKAGKTWAAIELASAIAIGAKWLGMPCRQGRVLYLNFELQEASLDAANGRLSKVWNYFAERGIDASAESNLNFVNLRGHPVLDAGIKTLCEQLVEAIAIKSAEASLNPFGFYSAIIFDPFYACSNADENSAAEIKAELRKFQALAEATGAAVIYVHHHAKGASGGKDSIDRGAGSGVHGRLPDIIVDMSELALSEKKLKAVQEHFHNPDVSVSRVSFNPRDFRPKKPLEVVFSYPVHHLAPAELQLDSCSVKGKHASAENKQERDDKKWSERNKLIGATIEKLGGTAEAKEVYEVAGFEETYSSFRRWLSDNRCDYHEVKERTEDGLLIKPLRLKE